MNNLICLLRTLCQDQALFVLFFVLMSSPILGESLTRKIEIAPFMVVSELSGGEGMIPGLRSKTYVFKTKKQNKEIVAYYSKLWKGQMKSVEGPDWFYHSNYNGKYMTVVQVKKRPKRLGFGSNMTSGMISISEPDETNDTERKVKVEVFYPITPGTKILSDLSAIDMGRKSRTTVFDIPGGVSTNLSHYKMFYEKKGWREAYSDMATEMVKNFGGASLVMVKDSDELVLSFIPDTNGRTKLVGVYVDK